MFEFRLRLDRVVAHRIGLKRIHDIVREIGQTQDIWCRQLTGKLLTAILRRESSVVLDSEFDLIAAGVRGVAFAIFSLQIGPSGIDLVSCIAWWRRRRIRCIVVIVIGAADRAARNRNECGKQKSIHEVSSLKVETKNGSMAEPFFLESWFRT